MTTTPPLPSSPQPLGQELLTRTRVIDQRTDRLLPLLDLLEEREGPSPLEALRETLVEILVAQRETGDRLSRIEAAMRLPARPPRQTGAPAPGASGTAPPAASSPAA